MVVVCAGLDLITILFFAALIYKMRPVKPLRGFNDGYLSLDTCNTLRGIFAIVVIFHHMSWVVEEGGLFSNNLFYHFRKVGYLAVAVFYFISGYGLQKRYLTDKNYKNQFLIKRFPKILIPYIIMTVLYWFVYAALGDVYTPSTIISKTIRGEPFVTFSWYILNILMFYLAFYILMKICKNKNALMIAGAFAFFVIWVFICKIMSYQINYCSTTHLLVVGMIWAVCEEKITGFLKRRYTSVFISVWASFWATFILMHKLLPLAPPRSWLKDAIIFIFQAITSLLFVTGVIMFMMKVTIRGGIWSFLGSISLELYMVHGIFLKFANIKELMISPVWIVFVTFCSIVGAYFLHIVFKHILKLYGDFILKLQSKKTVSDA